MFLSVEQMVPKVLSTLSEGTIFGGLKGVQRRGLRSVIFISVDKQGVSARLYKFGSWQKFFISLYLVFEACHNNNATENFFLEGNEHGRLIKWIISTL